MTLRPRPALRTRAKMLWDDEYFYVGAEMAEPHLWATLTQHDAVIFQDHDFEVFIDPDGDNHEYYEFEINALGTGWDLLLPRPYKDGGAAVDHWEIPGLRSAVHLDGTLNDPSDTDRGWSVELAFPWEVLGRAGPPPVASARRRPVARQLLPRRLDAADRGRPLREGAGHARRTTGSGRRRAW